MSKYCRLVSRLLPLLLAVALVGGCRRSKLNLNLRDTPGGAGGIPVGGAEFDAFPPGGGAGGFGGGLGGADGLGGAGGAGGAGGWQSTAGSMNVGDAASMAARRWEGVVVYFAYDSAAVGPSEMPKIETMASHLKQYPDYALTIEGHCDERGSDEYNRALGQQRAIVVRDLLISLGVGADRIEEVSYGEDRPVVPNATGESDHQQNRRAEFLLGPLK
ncbi:MAG: OmpA family protein [Lentisphaeria bacterium]|jgi:peptidoglycan-associated lipoprotein|nr:OmpA family protein [Lentisphaeria bacterium]